MSKYAVIKIFGWIPSFITKTLQTLLGDFELMRFMSEVYIVLNKEKTPIIGILASNKNRSQTTVWSLIMDLNKEEAETVSSSDGNLLILNQKRLYPKNISYKYLSAIPHAVEQWCIWRHFGHNVSPLPHWVVRRYGRSWTDTGASMVIWPPGAEGAISIGLLMATGRGDY